MNPMLRRIFSLLAAALAVLSHAAADDLGNLAEALRKGSATLASTAAGDQKPDSAHQQRLAETLRLLTEFDQALARANASAAQAVAGRLENDPTLPQPLRETAGRLRRELPALLDAREEAFVATVEKLVARTREQCLAAKKEADLQLLLREVSQLDQSKPSSRSPYTERAARKLKAVVTLLPKVRVWLGPDFTVYRSAVPPAVNARLDWVVRFNGKTVLTRSAKREMQFNYDGRKPGTYTIYLTEGGETPVSNLLDYTLTEEAVKKLGPRIIDDDFDRDGARNPPAPRDQ